MNGLDKSGAGEIRALLATLKAQGKTILLASHFQQDIDALCDVVYEMDQGMLAPVMKSVSCGHTGAPGLSQPG